MHVCHFSDTSISGSFFENLARGLSSEGVEITLMTLGTSEKPQWAETIPGVNFVSLGADKKIFYPKALCGLFSTLNKQDIDILQTHLYYPGLLGVLSKYFGHKKPVILTRHHSGVVRMLGSRFHIAADRWMAEKADLIVAASGGTANYARDIDRVKNTIQTIYYGFDFAKLNYSSESRSEIREAFNIGSNEILVGYIGNFISGKGHIELLRAFRKSGLPNGKLALIGRGELSEVTQYIEQNGLGEKVILPGFRTDVAECLSAMDVFVQPSLSEAFSQVLIEAMGVGLPVIATNVGGAAEVLEKDAYGLLIEPGDIDAMAERITYLYKDPQERKRFAEAGKKKVRSSYTVERMVTEHIRLYEDLLK